MRKLSDKKRLVILICIFAAFAMIIASAGVLSKWLIVPTVSAEPKFVVEADSSDLFTQEATYNGGDNIPELTPEGKLVFGECEFTITWNGGNYRSKVNGNEGIPKSATAHDNGNYAGEHFFTIIDNTTGQIIASNHSLVVKPKEVTVAPIESEIYFVGNTLKVEKLSLVGFVDDYKCDYTIEKRTVEASDYGAITASSVTASEKAYTVTVPQNHNLGGDEKNNNYCIPEGGLSYSIPFTVLPTCYSGSDSSTTYTYYGTLVAALNATQSADSPVNVIPMQSFVYTPTGGSQTTYTSGTHYNHVIDEDSIVHSGVTLLIPYDTTNTKVPTDYRTYDYNTFGMAGYLKNNVTISEGKTLTNNGTIQIAAQVTGGNGGKNNNSVVSGNYAQITMSSRASLQNYADIECYGFITEAEGLTQDQRPTVMMNSGKITVVFSVIEHRGGSAFLTMIGGILSLRNPKLETAPFNRFFIQSVATDMVISEEAVVIGYNTLSFSDKDSVTSIEFMSASTDAFIQLGEGTEAEFRYDVTSSQNKIEIKGNATVNPLNISITYMGMAIPLSTEDVFLPLSHYWNLTFSGYSNGTNATVISTKQDIKILPGASVTINQDVILNVNSIVVYENADKIYPCSNLAYPDDLGGGVLIVNGTLNAVNCAGYIQTQKYTGKLKISSENTLTIKELKSVSSSSADYESITIEATGDIYNGSEIIPNSNLSANYQYNGYYDGSSYAWGGYRTLVLSYVSNGGSSVANKTVGYWDGSCVLLEGSDLLPIPTRDNCRFEGWYTDSALTQPAEGQPITANTTLYAKWSAVLSFQYVYRDFETPPTLTPPGDITFYTHDTAVPIPTPTEDYIFLGWYIDSGCSADKKLDVTTLSGAEILNLTSADGKYVLYGLWSNAKYEITFDQSTDRYGELTQYFYTLSPGTLTNKLPTISSAHRDDTEKQYYFSYWAYVDSNGAEKRINTDDYSFISDTGLNEVTIKAVWIEKAHTITYVSEGSNNGEMRYYEGGDVATLLSTESVGWSFKGWYTATSEGTKIGDAEATYTPTEESITLYAQWDKYVVSFNANGGSCDPESAICDGKPLMLPTPTRTGYKFLGWYTAASGGNKIGDAGASYTPTANVTLYAQWAGFVVTYDANDGNCDTESQTYAGKALTLPSASRNSYTFNGWYTAKSGGTKIGDAGASYTPTSDITLYAQWKYNGCFTGDTLITLGDGTKKPVEDLTYEDMLLVWDFYSGEYAVMPIAAIINHGESVYDLITLWFEDNTKIELLSSHELFCADLNRWVCINSETVADYVGMSFVKASDDGYYTVKLTDYSVETKTIEAYSVLTAVHYNCIAGDLFALTPSMFGTTNYYVPFEIGENLKYDEEAMQADIEKYGLYTYEDFADHVTYGQFVGFNAAYLKVSVGKGLVTYEQLIESIYAYVNPSAEEETSQNTE